MSSSIDLIATALADTFDMDMSGITPESSFQELGLDSLAMVEMGLVLQEQTGIKLNDTELPRTVGELATLLEESEAPRMLSGAASEGN